MGRTLAQLPGYDNLTRIGRGAGATIYVGRPKNSRELFTIKHVVRHGPEDDRFLEQAENEYAVASKLDHPYLRKVIDVVRVRRWLKLCELFLIMEHVDGPRLEDEPPKDIDAMISVFLDTAEGLAAIHRAGFVHADIKPNNILLPRGGGLKIIDFGQSCPIGHAKERIQGTPDYMAPEQVLRQPLDPRTDVFNFGATMYWVTTGKWFKTMMNVGATGQMKMHVDARSRSEPPALLNPAIPGPLSQLIMDCCENVRDNRPREMKLIIGRLETTRHLLRKRLGETAS
jgi:eukaryotic-like serine/threonine-protein kinase